MKKRNGFVSNSSSTSFCIYGTWINDKDLNKLSKKLTKKNFAEDSDDLYHFINLLEEDYLPIDFTILHNDYEETLVGKAYSSMEQKETREEFEFEVENCFKNLGISDPEFLCGEIET